MPRYRLLLEAVFDKFKDDSDPLGYFRDISTFGGCTSGPAAAIEVLKIMDEEDTLSNVKNTGAYFIDQLQGLADRHAIIGDVRGKGLFAGVELVADRTTKEPLAEKLVGGVVADCAANGVIIGATNRSIPGYNNSLVFAPPLIATKSDIDEIVAAVDGALSRAV
ncbi:taurine--pyruvate aminotransferase [Ketogulonicigenium vulgare Y25]|nr:taurine--pyruvate aminotransferase [Ketogulonicigenium vulgare Y25]